MVGGTPKPFACNHEGCTMTFTTEDHLNVHQKKHEMDLDLSLGNKTNVFVADQTPTPTRFLRNCEEVGLFQDLQNVNPFEETFRRAVELGKNGLLPEHEVNTDDTLHTPHVFPLLSEQSIYSAKKNSNQTTIPTIKICDTDSENLPGKTIDIKNIRNDEIFQKDKDDETDNEDAIIVTNKDHDYALGTNRNEKDKNKAKVKLKQVIKSKKDNSKINLIQNKQPIQAIYLPPTLQTMNYTTLLLPTNASLVPIQQNLKPTRVHNITNKSKTVQSTNNKKLREKSSKDELLERNRAAASRCRQKKKQFIDRLQIEFDIMKAKNLELSEEISNLKSENAQLKSLLLAHRDCPVTKAMTKTELTPCGLIKVNKTSPPMKPTKNRLVLPKNAEAQIKIQKLTTAQIATENVALITPVQKSVIVIPKNHS